MPKSSTVFLGLDVHKVQTDVAIADADTASPVRHYGTITTTIRSVNKLIKAVRKKSAN